MLVRRKCRVNQTGRGMFQELFWCSVSIHGEDLNLKVASTGTGERSHTGNQSEQIPLPRCRRQVGLTCRQSLQLAAVCVYPVDINDTRGIRTENESIAIRRPYERPV